MQNPLLSRVLTLGANGMAGFMDLAVGMFVVAVGANFFALDVTFYHLLIGGFFALLPDMDIVPNILLFREPIKNHHLTPFHRPLLVLPAVALGTFFFAGFAWAIIAFVCVFWHYLHDTKWTRDLGGIAWFWPISDRYWSPLHGFELPRDSLSHQQYLSMFWLVPSSVSLFELGVGLVALYLALWITISPLLTIFLTGGALFAFVSIWLLYPRTQLKQVTQDRY